MPRHRRLQRPRKPQLLRPLQPLLLLRPLRCQRHVALSCRRPALVPFTRLRRRLQHLHQLRIQVPESSVASLSLIVVHKVAPAAASTAHRARSRALPDSMRRAVLDPSIPRVPALSAPDPEGQAVPADAPVLVVRVPASVARVPVVLVRVQAAWLRRRAKLRVLLVVPARAVAVSSSIQRPKKAR